jgi:FAD/FMN-containing dehydrogenase
MPRRKNGIIGVNPQLSEYSASRRTFLNSAVTLIAATGLGATRLSIKTARAQSSAPFDVPSSVDGEWLVDDASRQSASVDYGLSAHHVPVAVVKARTIEAVEQIIRYANQHGLKVAMRGQAHSLSGQALVRDGIIIDGSLLKNVHSREGDTVDAMPGALWDDVADATLANRLTPPVMPDAMMLSVGGTLSVGGIGENSYRLGAQVDHVLELDVVTGTGELITCSPTREEELFRMTLAGMGQCGIITRARLQLIQAPAYVAMRTTTYTDLDNFLTDQLMLAKASMPNLLNGRVTKNPQGQYRFVISAGTFVENSDEGAIRPDWLNSLRYQSEGALTTGTYRDYLGRRTASISAGKANKMPNPSVIVTLPAEATKTYLDQLLASPRLSLGIWFLEVSPKTPSRHKQPLQKMPESAQAFELRMQRRASATGAPDHAAMLDANKELVARALAVGGKIYPPFAPVLSLEQWQAHYGAAIWQRLLAAKKSFDPNNVLTPGAGMF